MKEIEKLKEKLQEKIDEKEEEEKNIQKEEAIQLDEMEKEIEKEKNHSLLNLIEIKSIFIGMGKNNNKNQ